MTTRREPALRVDHLSKTFPGIRALRDVSLGVQRAEIHALLGGNGSGKSTLLMILAGVYHADGGGVVAVGSALVPDDQVTPGWARSAGLRFVHQELGVFPGLSVAENLTIGVGFETRGAGAVDWRRVRRRAHVTLERFGIDADPDTPVHNLSPDARAMLAIARALQDDGAIGPHVYILDEPTAALPLPMAQVVYDALRKRRDAGHAVLLVSHRLDEVIATADAATVLRDGAVVGTRRRDEFDREDLIELIVGRSIARERPPVAPDAHAPIVLEARDLAGDRLHGVSLTLRRGEVVGIAGPLGAGRSELLQMLFGARPFSGGELLLEGEQVRFADIGDAMRAGLAYVPPDRANGAFGRLSLSENLSAASVATYWNGFRLRRRREAHDALRAMADFDIRASSPDQEMATLSGGNQQKVILGRWLRRAPRVLLLDEPTRGVDVGARAALHALVAEAVRTGTAALVASDDFEELSTIADRVLVLVRGRVAGELRQPDISASRVAELAFSAPTPT